MRESGGREIGIIGLNLAQINFPNRDHDTPNKPYSVIILYFDSMIHTGYENYYIVYYAKRMPQKL